MPPSNYEGQPDGGFILQGSKCPEANINPMPVYSTKAVYFLLDNSGSYQLHYDDAAQRMQDVLVQTLWPGDYVGIGLIGQESANMVIQNSMFPYPKEPIPPGYVPTLTPLPGDALGSDLQQHEIESGNIERENAESKDTYYCSILDWNNSYDLTSPQRNNIQFFQMIRESLPGSSQIEGSTDVQSALYNAHDFFDQARKLGYTNLKLIILSDMAQTEPPEGWVKSVDLSGVSVLVAMVPFDTGSDEVSFYIQRKEEWTNWFNSYRVVDFELLSVPSSSTPILVSYISR